MDKYDFIIMTNGPGEVSGWVRPFVNEIVGSECSDRIRVTVFLTPCTFASGKEADILRGIPGIDRVIEPKEYMRYFLLNVKPAGFRPSGKGIVIHMGGDHAHTILMAKRLKYPSVLYTEGRHEWHASFDLIMVEDDTVKSHLVLKGIEAEKVRVVGNLMVDAVRPSESADGIAGKLGLAPDRIKVGLFPGSRPKGFGYLLSLFLEAAELMSRVGEPIDFIMPLSFFLSREKLVAELKELKGRGSEDLEEFIEDFDMSDESGAGWILLKSGNKVHVYWGGSYDIMNILDLAFAVPGTNNAELAAVGVPMIIVLPTGKPEIIPLTGLKGIIGNMPILGSRIKSYAVRKILERVDYISIPNRKAKKMIVPEIKGNIKAEDMVIPAMQLLKDVKKRRKISEELKTLMGQTGAAKCILENIVSFLDIGRR